MKNKKINFVECPFCHLKDIETRKVKRNIKILMPPNNKEYKKEAIIVDSQGFFCLNCELEFTREDLKIKQQFYQEVNNENSDSEIK